MAEKTIEFGQLAIHPKDSRSICKTFISEPEKEKEFGRLFGIIEIESPQSKLNFQILEKLSAEIQDIYFKTAQAEIKSRPNAPLDFETIFEHSLHKINQVFLEINNQLFLSQVSFEPSIKSPGKINAALALVQDKKIYLTQSGRVFSFFIYQTKPNDYKIINILENAAGQEAKNEIKRISFFPNIINGQIEIGNSILLCTESVLDYLSMDKIKKTIGGRSPEEASSLIKNLLDEIESSSSFGALIVRYQPEAKNLASLPATPVTNIENLPPLQSMQDLLSTESKTEKILAPSLGLNIRKPFLNILTGLKSLKPKEGKNLKTSLSKIIKLLIFYPALFVGKILYLLFRLFYQFILLTVYFVLGQNKKRKKITQEIAQEIKQPFKKTAVWFSTLPRLSKIFLIIALIFIFLFAQSIFFLNKKYKNEIEIEAYNSAVNTIQNKKNEAEASLIYNDEENARKKLLEAQDLAENLSENSRKRKETKENLLKEIKILLAKLQHITDVEDPFLVADLSNQDPQVTAHGLFAADGYLYTLNYQNNLIYKINLESKEILPVDPTISSSIRIELGVQKNKNSILFYHNANGLFEFDLENQTGKTVDITFENNEQSVKDIDLYNQRVYILDIKNSQIWRHSPTLSGYARGTPWLKENLDITSASSMAIDGEIYLIKSNGEILRLANGYKENFETKIDPPLSSPTQLWTSTDSNYLYILEPQTKRLVVLDKNGKIKIQYRSSQFDNLKNFVVLEKEKKIYLLSGTKIYGIAATHL